MKTVNIAMIGDACADLAFYIGNVLGALGETVLVEDQYSNRKADYCIGIPKGTDFNTDIISFKRVEYAQIGGLMTEDYSVVITLYGTELSTPGADLALFVVNETSEGYQKMYNNAYPKYENGVLIVRDSYGIIKKDFKNFAKKNELGKPIFIKVNKKDAIAKLALEFNHEIRLSSCSDEIQGIIYDSVMAVRPETTKKEFASAIKKAEKGVK